MRQCSETPPGTHGATSAGPPPIARAPARRYDELLSPACEELAALKEAHRKAQADTTNDRIRNRAAGAAGESDEVRAARLAVREAEQRVAELRRAMRAEVARLRAGGAPGQGPAPPSPSPPGAGLGLGLPRSRGAGAPHRPPPRAGTVTEDRL